MLRTALRRTALGVTAVGAVEAARYTMAERSDHHTLQTGLTQMLIFDAMRIAGRLARRRHDQDCAEFASVQASMLRARLEANKATEYGRDHHFDSILAADDVVATFRKEHPLTTYEHFAPYVERVAQGEPNGVCPALAAKLG